MKGGHEILSVNNLGIHLCLASILMSILRHRCQTLHLGNLFPVFFYHIKLGRRRFQTVRYGQTTVPVTENMICKVLDSGEFCTTYDGDLFVH